MLRAFGIEKDDRNTKGGIDQVERIGLRNTRLKGLIIKQKTEIDNLHREVSEESARAQQ